MKFCQERGAKPKAYSQGTELETALRTLLAGSLLGLAAALSACSSTYYEDGLPNNQNQAGSERQSARSESMARDAAPSGALHKEAQSVFAQEMLASFDSDALTPVQDTENYAHFDDNPVKIVAQQPTSTFGADVDTASYSNVRRFLNDGRLPPADAVRVEELINYFDYDYPRPQAGRPLALKAETYDSPWKAGAKILKIDLAAENKDMDRLPPANIVMLIDVSGSMQNSDKLPLAKKTMRMMLERMRPTDRISIVTYASGVQVVLPSTPADDKDAILSAIDKLQAGGSTSGGAAIKLAYEQAEKNLIKNGVNRIILCSDGDFNVGVVDPEALKTLVSEKRKHGVSLSVFGFGTGNYNDAMMEKIADAGDGNYTYIDGDKEARRAARQQLESTLATVAKDVKAQVEFNPAQVKEYRQIGYENRALRREDFDNDNVDSGDVGAGQNVTVLYEYVPVGAQGWNSDLRYQQQAPVASGKSSEIAYIKIRYKGPQGGASNLFELAVPSGGAAPLAQAGADVRFAVAVASYGQLLRGGNMTGTMTWEDVERLAKGSVGADKEGFRSEFVELVGIAKRLSASARPDPDAAD